MSLSSRCETAIELTIVSTSDEGHGGFGRDAAALLRGVEAVGSLNMAAKRCKMAYSRAWRLIRDSEEELGIKLLNRDGARGSTLTDEGKQFLDNYEQLLAELHDHANSEFARLFKN